MARGCPLRGRRPDPTRVTPLRYCWHVKRAKDNECPNKTMFPIDKRNLHCVILGISTLYAFAVGPKRRRVGVTSLSRGRPYFRELLPLA